MTAQQLISDSIIPLRTSETGDTALGIMNDFYVRHLPIVNDKQLLGLVSEEDILEHDAHEPVGSYKLSLMQPFVKYNDHLYEILRLISEYRLTLIPVVDEDENYIGLVTLEDVLQFFSKTASFSEPGSIIVLEMSENDYNLTEIAQIAQSNDAKVLSLFLVSHPESTRLEVAIKLNKTDISAVLQTFDRYGYYVKASFGEEDDIESLKENYDSLINYLNI